MLLGRKRMKSAQQNTARNLMTTARHKSTSAVAARGVLRSENTSAAQQTSSHSTMSTLPRSNPSTTEGERMSASAKRPEPTAYPRSNTANRTSAGSSNNIATNAVLLPSIPSLPSSSHTGG